MFTPQHRPVNTKKADSRTDQTQTHVDGRDILEWNIDTLGAHEHLRAISADLGFDVSGKDLITTLTHTLSYSGARFLSHPYELYVENTLTSARTQILGPDGKGLDLVIDTIGGMVPKPPDDDGPGEGDHRQDPHGDRD